MVERQQLFRRVLFCFLTGGEDMHLKNWSLITRTPRVQLAPAYDLLNSTIALRHPLEEMALPLNGKKRQITRRDLVEYFGGERLGLDEEIIERDLTLIREGSAGWPEAIRVSFLPAGLIEKYLGVLRERVERLWGACGA